MIKYMFCFLIEKHHRKVFDKWYRQDSVITLLGIIDIFLLNILQKLMPDYRRFLREKDPIKYNRYTPEWEI